MNFEFLSIYIANSPLLRGHAYLDPGSGSFLIQLLIAGLVGAGFAIKLSWKKIKRLFNRSAAEPEAEKPDDTDQEG
jgi:hypothetical protein